MKEVFPTPEGAGKMEEGWLDFLKRTKNYTDEDWKQHPEDWSRLGRDIAENARNARIAFLREMGYNDESIKRLIDREDADWARFKKNREAEQQEKF